MAKLDSSNKKWASMSSDRKKSVQDALSRVKGNGGGYETPQQALQRIASQGQYTPRSAFEMNANPYTGEAYDGNQILRDYISKVKQANQQRQDYERQIKQMAMNELRMAAQEPIGDRNNPDLYQSRTKYSTRPQSTPRSTFDPSNVKFDPTQIAEMGKTQRIGNTKQEEKKYDYSNVDYEKWVNPNSDVRMSSATPEEMMKYDNTGVRQDTTPKKSVSEMARELLRDPSKLPGAIADATQDFRSAYGRGTFSPSNTYRFADGIQLRRTGSGGNTFMGQRMSGASQGYEESYMAADRNQRRASIAAAQNDPNNPLNLAEQFIANNPAEENGFTGKYKEYDAYVQMTNEQKAVYNYVYATYGPQQAEEYKDGLMDMLNARVGQEMYNTQIRYANALEKALASYSQGVNSGLEGVANLPAAFLEIDNRQAASPEEYAASYIRTDPNNNNVESVLYDLASSTGNMTPGMIAGALGAPQLVGNAIFGASQAGNAYNQALQNGNTTRQASLYATQQFVDEQLTNYLLGGVNAFGGGMLQRVVGEGPVGQAINNAINRVAKTESGRRILRSVAQMLGDAAGEAQQEYLQFFTDNFTQALLGMRDENGNLVQMNTNLADPDALYSAALGALNALFLNMPNTATRMLNGRNADVSNARELADSLKDISADDFTGKESFKQAQEVQRIAEEIAEKQENGETITAAEKIAFSEAVNDMMTIGSETDEESGEEKVEEVETNYWTEKEAAEAEKKNKAALKAFEQAENVRLPQDVADQMINSYTRGDAHQYMQAYKRMYVAGENDVDFETAMRSPLARTYLNSEQLHQAYAAGVARANLDKGVLLKPGTARKGGLTYADENATAAQKKVAQWAGDKTGFSIEIRSDAGEGDIDFENKVIRINPKSKNFNQTLAHELTHLLRRYDNDGYNKYTKLVVQALMDSRNVSYDQLYKQYETEYGKTGTTPNVDDVIEEMVAQGAGEFLNDEAFIEKVVNEDRSLAEKIIDFFRGIVNALRETSSQDNISSIAKALKENEERYQQALDTWTAALDRASENSRNGMEVDDSTNAIRHAIAESGDSQPRVKEQIANGLDKLRDMDSVANIELVKGDYKTVAVETAKRFGFKIDRQGFGVIDISKEAIRDSFKYVTNDAEAAAYQALPYVLKRGIYIGSHENHKGRGMDTITIAAPITIEGVDCYMGAVVKLNKNRYKAHRIIMTDEESIKNTAPNGRGVADNRSLANRKGDISNSRITSNKAKVKKQLDIDETKTNNMFDHPELARDTGTWKAQDLVSKDDTRYSLGTFDSVGRKNLANQLKSEVESGNMTQETADHIKDQMEWAYRLIERYSNSQDFPMFSAWQTAEYKLGDDGTPVFSVIVPNGDYELNMDFTTVCKKRDTLDQVLTALARTGNLNYRKLNQAQISKINQIIKANGFEIACSTCFVDSKRYNIVNWAHSLTDGTKSRNGYNQAIASMLNDKVGANYFNYVSRATTYNGKETFTAGQKLLSELTNEELLELNPHAFDYIDERLKKLDSKKYEYRMLKAIRDNQHMRSFLNPNDFISSMGQDIIQEQNPELNALINSLGGSSRPKPSHGRVAYYSEIVNNRNFTPEAAFAVGGVRVQSFSDYMANMVFDYMQMIGDMAAKKLPAHAYTKEPMFAKLYGLTGMKINMSIMPKSIDWADIIDLDGLNTAEQAVKIHDFKKNLTKNQISQLKKYAGLKMTMDEKGNFHPVTDENGNYIPIFDDETFPMEEALAIRSADGYKNNCGTIWIGTSDEQIRTLLRMEEADMVIPYHASSLNPAVKEMRNIEYLHDYTSQQRTRRRENGKLKAIPAKMEFDFYESLMRTKDGKATANEYLAWCDERGYTPKFHQFRDEENYYKLLEDFRLYTDGASSMQQAVDVVYPGEDSAFGTFEELMRQSLEEANNTADSLGKKLPSIVEQIQNEFGLTESKQLRKQLDIDDSNAGFESEAMFNDNQDIQSASETLGKILSEIDEMPSKKVIADTAYMLRKTTNTNVGVDQIKENLTSIFEYLTFNRSVDGADISHIVADFVGTLYDDGKTTINPVEKEVYDEFRDKLRTYTFHMPSGFEGEIEKLGGIGALRREFFGTMNITKEKGIPIDKMWDELCDLYPEYFDRDIANPADQLESLVDTIRGLKPQPTTNELGGEDYDVLRYTVGQDVLKAFVQNSKNAEMREQYEKKLEKGLQKAKDKAKAQKERAKLKKLDKDARKRLLRKAQELSKMKGGPEFEAARESLIGDLDVIAVGLRRDTRAKLEALQRQATEQAARDPEYKELYFDSAQEVFSRLSKRRIKDMTSQEVSELTDKIVELVYQQRAYTKMLNEQQGVMVATVGRRAMAQQAYAKGINEKNTIGATLGRVGLNMLNPTRAFQAIDGYQQGGVFGTLGKQLNDGQTRMNTFVMNANKKFNDFLDERPDLVRTWSVADIDTGFKDDKGDPVMISKGMRISLYLHSLNRQNENHIATAGIKIPNAKLYNKGKYDIAYRSGDANHTGYSTTVKLTTQQLKAIASQMTEDEKAFADLAHDFLNNDTKNAINEVSLILNGTYKAKVENYFPIKADTNFTMGDITGLVKDGTIEGMDMLKERQKGASVPILLEDVAQVLQRQINNTGKYYGLAVPIRDINKIMKFNENAGKRVGVRDAIESAWGKTGTKYITDVISQLQGGAPADNGPGAEIFNRLKSTYAGTVLNWNLGVAIKQSASAPFAAVVLDAKSVAKAMTMNAISKANYDYMDSITPWSYMRRQGMSGTEMGEVYRQKNPVENSKAWQKAKQKLNWIQGVDVWTTDRLFFATEYYVQDHFPDLEVRGEAYNKKVAELYNDMLQRTQPSYDVMQRNAYLRSGNAFTKVMGMFKTQTFNMGGEVIDAWGRMQASKRMLKDHRISEDQAKAAKAQFGKTVGATVASQMMLTMLGIVAKAVMHNMRDYRDDKGEVTPESVAARGMYDFLTSFAGMMIGGNEVQSFGLAVSGKEKWYDLEYPGLSVINDLISSGVNMMGSFRKAVESGWDPKDVDAFKKNAIKFSMNAAIGKRIPANNIYNIANMMNLWYQDYKNGKLWTWDAGEGLFGIRDSSVTKEQYARQAVDAVVSNNIGKAEYALGKTNKDQLGKAISVHVTDKMFEKYAEDPESMNDILSLGLKARESFESKISKANEDGSITDEEIRDVAMLMISEGLSSKDAYTLYLTRKADDKKAAEWVGGGHDFGKYLDGKKAMTEFSGDDKREKVVGYIKDYSGSREEKELLWEMAGYQESTYNQYNDPNSEEYKKAAESAKKKAEKAAEEKARGVTEQTKEVAKEIDAKIPEDTDKYLYVSQSTEYTPQQKVEWFKADKQRTEGKKYVAWKNVGGADFDYIKYRGDLSRYTGLSKKEKKAKVTDYIDRTNLSKDKKRVLWTFADYKETTSPW